MIMVRRQEHGEQDVSDSNGNPVESKEAEATAAGGAPAESGAPDPTADNPSADSAEAGQSEAEQPTELEELAAERDRLKDQLLRTSADFENFRKRSKRDVEDADRRAREETLKEFLPVIDNLERAAAAAEQEEGPVAEGVRMVLRQFEEVCERLGLERIEAVGQRFDPNVHDAVQQQESAEHAPGTVVAEVVPGYRLKGRLLRAAMVVVARAPSGSA
jgi:molecular chaperone GrpE